MKILAVIGDPQKKKGYELANKIKEEIKNLGEIEFNYLCLTDVNLEQCTGCFTCIKKGASSCPLKDDRAGIEKQMLGVDGVIFIAPVYSMNVPALMKNFFDRFAYISYRPRFFNYYVMVAAMGAGIGLEATLRYLETITRSWGFNFVCNLGIENQTMGEDDYRIKRVVRKLYNAFKKKESFVPRLKDLLQFRIMRANAIIDRNDFPYNYNYYKEKGFMDKKYFIETKINIFKNVLVWLAEGILRKAMRKKIIKKPEKI